ncbi:MAG: hypothetical protein V1793_08120 [Pseudomonadota bacterium]
MHNPCHHQKGLAMSAKASGDEKVAISSKASSNPVMSLLTQGADYGVARRCPEGCADNFFFEFKHDPISCLWSSMGWENPGSWSWMALGSSHPSVQGGWKIFPWPEEADRVDLRHGCPVYRAQLIRPRVVVP